ncbi:MAG: valine--tRNA ligase, partial [Acidobacteriaceae bacterium]|nr:valine--tRNA ligase [Acidobacteriaceae bacterium]
MVNWCPRCQTAISDVETAHEAVEGHLWHIRYPIKDSDEALIVATTRPETMLGDTAVAVDPGDERYSHLHGKTVILPLVGREIPVITDPLVDQTFGTGVVKVTPAHDPNDFEMGRRHGLAFVKVIGEDARMTSLGGPYVGLDRFEARKRVVAALEQSGELAKTESYTVNISKCYRCNTTIEPLVSVQWYVRTKPLAQAAINAVRSGRIRFVPDDREIVFFQWMENIRDWCISRQLWWGHRIPAWHCHNCHRITVARETPPTCPHCHSTELEQDSDVLDTWFSSGLWPFSTLGWPDPTEDLVTFYPTSLMITGFDILFFWVSRMMMLGIECTGDVPFREVHIHGLVRDPDKQKMSKTKGNVIDPLIIMDRFGTDAVRIALLISAAAGSDIALKEDRMESGQGFANKLWNASRLLFMNLERSKVTSLTSGDPRESPRSTYIEDTWIFERLNRAIEIVNRALEQHRYHEVAQTLWDFAWHDFCDWYLEVKKLRFRPDSGEDEHWRAALFIYESMLRLLHPVMPFITEELWQRLVQTLAIRSLSRSISLEPYPSQPVPLTADSAPFTLLQEIVTDAREQRVNRKIDPKITLSASLAVRAGEFSLEDLSILRSLTRLEITQSRSTDLSERFQLRIEPAAAAQNGILSPEARARLAKEIANQQRALENTERQLNNSEFLSRAPEKVIASLRAKRAEYQIQIAKNKKLLEGRE